MNTELPVLDLEDVDSAGLRPVVVTYGPHVFGIKYYKTRISPATVIMFEETQAAAEDATRMQEAQAKLNLRAKEIEERDGLDASLAMEKAKRINTDLVDALNPRVKTDRRATSQELTRLVPYVGLKSAGELILPSESFFLGRDYEFHAVLLKAIMDDYARPTSESQEGTVSQASSTGSPASSELEQASLTQVAQSATE
jgi:hypothetical protein